MGVIVRTMTAMTLVLVVSGCASLGHKTATDWQLDLMKDMGGRSHTHEQDMIDNAVLADLSLAEFHFIPHSGELSGSGVARLDRMAPLLDAYGGTVRYAANVADEELVKERIAQVREYLSMTGCNMDRVTIEPGLAGGRGVLARHALDKQEQFNNPTDKGGGAVQTLSISGR